MHNIPQSELTPKLRQLVEQTLSTHKPLTITIDGGENIILLAEQDYRQLLNGLNQNAVIFAKGLERPELTKKRVFGSARGLIKLADDFDAPLDDFKDYS